MTELPVTGDYITQLYLYGESFTPKDLTDRLRDLPGATVGAGVNINIQNYMETYGKYAVPARAEFVQDFFSGTIDLEPGVYTVGNLKSTYSDSMFRITYVNAQVDIGQNNYMDRAYIFGHSGFHLSDDTEFTVGPNGELSMNNVSVIPEDDNFDFESTGISQYLNDFYLQPAIDPSQIGRTVNIYFTGTATVSAYTADTYASDIARIAGWDDTQQAAVAAIGGNIIQYVNEMRQRGVFENERDGRKIVYDGLGTDEISADLTVGSILIGGAGADIITGGNANDIAYGGLGDDTFFASSGADDIWGGDEDGQLEIVDHDTVNYSGQINGITVNYDGSSVLQVTGLGGIDTLHSIEEIIGTSKSDYFTYSGDIPEDLGLIIDAGNGHDVINVNEAASGLELNIDANGNGTLTSGVTGGQIQLRNFHTQIIGSNFDDILIDDSSGDKRIDGGMGNDIISTAGSNGNATLYGGVGQDTLTGGDGNDILIDEMSLHQISPTTIALDSNTFSGGAGSDYIESHSFVDIIDGGSGDDYIKTSFVTGSYSTIGQNISGGTGNDYIEVNGLVGINFTYNLGDGNDRIIGDSWGWHNNVWTQQINIDLNGIYTNEITLIWDVPTQNSAYTGVGDLAIIFSDGGSIYIDGVHGSAHAGQNLTQENFAITFNNHGTIYTALDVQFGDASAYATDLTSFNAATSSSDTTGTAEADNLRGDLGDNTLSGGDGNDIFAASGGNDAADGGNGSDTLELFGARSNFSVTQSGSDVIVSDQTGREGVMMLTSVETVYFITDNQSYTMEDFFGYYGTSSANTIVASNVDNAIYGLGGNDILSALDGDDTISGGAGDDAIDGGLGSDFAIFAGFADDYQISRSSDGSIAVTDTAGTDGNDILVGIEYLSFEGDSSTVAVSSLPMYGASGDDLIIGDDGNNTIYGQGGNDEIQGGVGFDTLDGGDGNDLLVGGEWDDTLSGGAGTDTAQFSGSLSDYLIYWSSAGEVAVHDKRWIDGYDILDGVEIIEFAEDSSTLLVSSLAPYGTNGADNLTGTDRADYLIGLDGDDILTGSLGGDRLDGGAGADIMIGGEGDDYYIVDDAEDVIIEATDEGYEWVDIYNDYYALPGNVEDASVMGDLATTIIGNDLNNFLWGYSEDDILSGMAGDDILEGDDGDDRLIGGAGDDELLGEEDNDTAVFAGNQSTYSISTSGGTIQVTDNNAGADGDDGTDTLIEVETAEFKYGVTVNLAAPIVLDLDGDGVELVSRKKSKTKFDWNEDGKADRTGWVGRDDGLLVYDRNHDGKVSGADELSFLDDKKSAKSDLDGLSAFDGNGDRIFSADDEAFADFRVWRDRNGNGRNDRGELVTLTQAGIVSINLAGEAVDQTWGWNDNITINTASFTRTDGSTGALGDVALNYDSSSSGRGNQMNEKTKIAFGAASRFAEAIAAFGAKGGTDDLADVLPQFDRRDAWLAVASRLP